eukprot:NODE_8416_length_703_cov_20.531034_g8160_i0.p1 GENE.NODE_8416_length_703_cov_20.531034_g8160_i0~~NODE_8416_length_703_cov_20.531034_g8160_i0.p1  ORF type:complete len:159 (-),score=17.56 NODE_8416_length_703_cov_20.531034_g8160_i0:162-638(-)
MDCAYEYNAPKFHDFGPVSSRLRGKSSSGTASPATLELRSRPSTTTKRMQQKQQGDVRRMRRAQSEFTVHTISQPHCVQRRKLTRPQPFHIHTDERAERRAEFDNYVKQKERRQRLALRRLKRQQAIEEDKQLRAYRKTLFIKARPSPFQVQRRASSH